MRNLSIRMQATNQVIFLGLVILLSTRLVNSQETSGVRNPDQWRQVTSPEGGSISALLCRGNLVLAETSNGVFISEDSGAHWKAAGTGLPGTGVKAFALSGARILAATYDGIFRSDDQGRSWQPTNGPPDVKAFAVVGNQIFAAANFKSHWTARLGLFRSTDQGQSWARVGELFPDTLAATGTSLLAGTSSGVYRSTDGGQNWTPTLELSRWVNTLAVSGARIFAGTEEGIFVSVDDGKSWTLANRGLPRPYEYKRGPSIEALAVSGATLLAATASDLFRSTDYGQNWQAVSFDLNVNVLAADSQQFWVGTDGGGVFLSTDRGQNWLAKNRGLTGQYLRSMTASGKHLYAQMDGGVFARNDDEANWKAVRVNEQGKASSLVVANGRLWALSPRNELFVSTDEGQNWTPVKTGMERQSIYDISAVGPHLVLNIGGKRFISADGGASWTMMGLGGSVVGVEVTSFAVSGGRWLAGTQGEGVWVSSDRGQNWTPLNRGLPSSGARAASVTALAVSHEQVFAMTSEGMFVLTGNEVQWKAVNQELPVETSVEALAVSGANLLVGLRHKGVYFSPDGGRSWQPSGWRLPNPPTVTAFAVSPANIFAATPKGVFRSADNGQSWQAAGLTDHVVGSLVSNGTTLVAATDKGLFLSADNAQSWKDVQTSSAQGIRIIAVIGTRLLAGGWRDLLFSDDHGRNWQKGKLDSDRDPQITSLIANGNEVLAGAFDGGIYHSTDQGQSWEALNASLPQQYPLVLAASQTELWAATGQRLLISTNQGHSWRPTALRGEVYSIATLGDKLLAGTGRGVLVSTDRGRSWQPSGLKNRIPYFALSGTRIFAGTSDGVYVSTDEGRSWTEISEKLSDRDVRQVAATRTMLYARTNGGQLFARPLAIR